MLIFKCCTSPLSIISISSLYLLGVIVILTALTFDRLARSAVTSKSDFLRLSIIDLLAATLKSTVSPSIIS